MGLSFLGTNGILVGAPHCAQTASYISRSFERWLLRAFPARFATDRLILKAFLGIEFLFACGENEFRAAILAYQCLVLEHVSDIPL